MPRISTSWLLALVVGGLVLPSTVVAQRDRQFAKRMDALLDEPPFDRVLWGVSIVDARGRTIYGRNDRRLFIPASNTKLVVTTVASALLPPDWTVRTSLYGNGPLVNGVLLGDLVLYGRGDPTFSRRCYALDTTVTGACDTDPFQPLRVLADSLRARGVRVVAGDLVGDGSYFGPEVVHGSWEAYDLNWWYAAPVSGLGFNDNSIDILWAPGALIGMPAAVVMSPDLGIVSLENHSWTRGDEAGPPLDFFRDPGTLRIRAEGSVPLNAQGTAEYFALPDPNYYTASALRSVLAEKGIAVRGTTRSTTDSLTYAPIRRGAPLAEVVSRPLRDWIFPILNSSQNWFAEMLLKQLGKQFGGAGTWDAGITVERRFLIDSVKVDSASFHLSDGSGLASENLIAPATFTRLLHFIRRHPRFSTFIPGLPAPGQPGTLRTRLVGTPLQGRLKAKTGTTSLASTLSGYLETSDGQAIAVSIQGNHHSFPDRLMKARIDTLLLEVGKRYK